MAWAKVRDSKKEKEKTSNRFDSRFSSLVMLSIATLYQFVGQTAVEPPFDSSSTFFFTKLITHDASANLVITEEQSYIIDWK